VRSSVRGMRARGASVRSSVTRTRSSVRRTRARGASVRSSVTRTRSSVRGTRPGPAVRPRPRPRPNLHVCQTASARDSAIAPSRTRRSIQFRRRLRIPGIRIRGDSACYFGNDWPAMARRVLSPGGVLCGGPAYRERHEAHERNGGRGGRGLASHPHGCADGERIQLLWAGRWRRAAQLRGLGRGLGRLRLRFEGRRNRGDD
jgi:hypothetical protein